MRRIFPVLVGLLFLLPSQGKSTTHKGLRGVQVEEGFGRIPLYFIHNKGQVNKRALFYAKTRGYTLWITKQGLVFDSVREKNSPEKRKKEPKEKRKVTFQRKVQWLKFVGANPAVKVEAGKQTSYRVNYFIGRDPSKWKRDIPTSKEVTYRGLYPGIDLRVYGRETQIEYDWIVRAGADPSKIVFRYEGVKTHIDKEGNIVVEGKFGNLIHKKPVATQDGKAVKAKFVKLGANLYGIKVGDYDRREVLVIDPAVKLAYSTYLGGSGDDRAVSIAVDSSRAIYIVGRTVSTDFPIQNPYQATKASWWDVFITKFSPSGDSLVYSTYLGGDLEDNGRGIAVDSSGNAYVTGKTSSWNFPITSNPYQTYNTGKYDVFVTKLSPSGDSLVYSTYLGGGSYDYGYDLTIDSSGAAYIVGCTRSNDFPTQDPYQANRAGDYDAFLTKLSPGGIVLFTLRIWVVVTRNAAMV